MLSELPSTTEGMLEYVSKRNRFENNGEDTTGTTNFGKFVRGSIQRFPGRTGKDENSINEGSRGIYKESGDSSNISEDSVGTSDSTRWSDHKSTTDNSSTYQHVRSNTTTDRKLNESATKRIYTSFKQIASGLKEAVKQEPDKKKIGKKATVRKLTDAEIIQLRPKLIESLIWQSEHMDQFIEATTKGHESVTIWSDLDRDEIEIVADFLLERGKKSERTAQVVRNMSTLMLRIKLGMISLPRAYKTFATYIERGFSISLKI